MSTDLLEKELIILSSDLIIDQSIKQCIGKSDIDVY